jgi:hypothetical protein
MVNRVREWLRQRIRVKIFTARVAPMYSDAEQQRSMIQAWCEIYLGQKLEVTCVKDGLMYELWDDRAVGVFKNTGERLSNSSFDLSCSACGKTDVHAADCWKGTWTR